MTPGFSAGLILALPLGAAILLVLLSRLAGRAFAGIVAAGAVVVAFGVAVSLAVRVAAVAGPQTLFQWFGFSDPGGGVQLGFTLQVDPLASFMTLVVTGVGALIVIYSIGYMWHDAGFTRFMVYMDFFIFSMLLLVLAGNFVLLVVGWGLVGLASYLLIGFWYERRSAVLAARKAFVMNVIGDVGMVIGALVIFWNLRALDFATVFARSHALPRNGTVIVAITLLLLVGAVAKSAQLPLHTWLPDAMEGPTPVSALIHAATMVTAGVYLVARMHPLFDWAPTSAAMVAVIGAVTAIFAATIALVQVDIKRVLAYSTMSQIGYMFLAVGVGAYSAGLFHLLTHAFFKALLFLAAGNVIHALSDEQDIRLMGGLRRALPYTRVAFLIGAAAIAGVPLLSGFFSKEAILGAAWSAGPVPPVLWAVGVVTAVLTGFYMFRLYLLTFEGTSRVARHLHPHEAPPLMLVPVLILAALAALGGYIELGQFGNVHLLGQFLAGCCGGGLVPALPEPAAGATVIAVLAGLVGIAGAFLIYAWRWLALDVWRARLAPVARVLEHRYYVDEIYDAMFVRLNDGIARILDRSVERGILDGGLDLVRDSIVESGALLRPIQSGLVRSYALFFLAGAAAVVSALVLSR